MPVLEEVVGKRLLLRRERRQHFGPLEAFEARDPQVKGGRVNAAWPLGGLWFVRGGLKHGADLSRLVRG